MDWTTNPILHLLVGQNSSSCLQQLFSNVVTRNRKFSYGKRGCHSDVTEQQSLLGCHAVNGQAVLVSLKALGFFARELHTPWCRVIITEDPKFQGVSNFKYFPVLWQIICISSIKSLAILMWCCTSLLHG
jgi:hypothetical protein